MKEIWKDIKGYEGSYQVSNLARVKSLDRYIGHYAGGKRVWKGRVLRQGGGKNFYYTVSLNGKTHKVHRLLAEAFIANPKNYPCINHKDGNKLNNSLDNLEWCTWKHNLRHAYDTGLQVPLERILNNHQERIVYRSLQMGLTQDYLSRVFNVSRITISRTRKRLSNV